MRVFRAGLAAHGIAALATLSNPDVERQFLDREGRVIQRCPDPRPFTSWDAAFHQLRAAFPDHAYHQGRECDGLATAGPCPPGVRVVAAWFDEPRGPGAGRDSSSRS